MDTCLICGSRDFLDLQPRYSRQPNRLCRACGLVFSPTCDARTVHTYYYADGYQKRSVNRSARKSVVSKGLLLHNARAGLRFYESFILNDFRDKRVIDVGCGYGGVLAALRADRNCHVVGLEPSPETCAASRAFFGLDLISSTLEDFHTDERFDVVMSVHCIEHSVDPVDFLKRLRALLRDDGVMYIECPNLLAPTGGFALRRFFERDHLFNFTVATLTALAGRAGLEVVRERHSGHLKLLLRKSDAPPSAPALTAELRENGARVLRFFRTYPVVRWLQFRPIRLFFWRLAYLARVLWFKLAPGRQ